MKIGIFTDSYKPYTSGVVTSIATFKEELEKMGHEVYIFAPSYPHYHEEEEGVYRFYSVPSPTNPDYTLAIPVYPGMQMLIKRLKLDIIHVHTPFIMGRVGLRYARKYGIPLVFTYHTRYDQYVHYVPVAQDLAKDITIKYSNSFCNHCNHIIVPSEDIKEIIMDGAAVKTPITVLPTGVPIDRFNGCKKENWLRKNYRIPDKNKILLFVGRLTKEKNLPFLIKAFKKLKAKSENFSLVITAQGPMESELKSLCRTLELSLETEVIFTGAVPFTQLIDVYYSADLFVFSSLTETQGLVLIEAMAAGLPVVAVRASGVQDMVSSGVDGILTKEDIAEFTNSVFMVMENEEYYQRLKANALLKADSLSSRAMAVKLAEIYEGLVEKNIYPSSKMHDVGAWLGR